MEEERKLKALNAKRQVTNDEIESCTKQKKVKEKVNLQKQERKKTKIKLSVLVKFCNKKGELYYIGRIQEVCDGNEYEL